MKFKSICTLSFLCILLHTNAQELQYNPNNVTGQNYTSDDGMVKTYAIPSDYPYIESVSKFNVQVNGTAFCGIYNDKNQWIREVAFTSFEFEQGKETIIDIAYKDDLTDYEILPKNAQATVEKISDHSLRIKLNKADQNLTLVTGKNYRRSDVLHLFANSIDKEAPSVELNPGQNYKYDRKKKLYYFGPGYHKLSERFANGELNINVSGSIYIAGGAVLDGHLGINNAKGNAKIYGRGMIMNAEPKIILSVSGSDGCSVDGIMIHGHRAQCWQTTVGSSKNVKFSNVKVISTRYASTDGIDITHLQDSEFDNCFVRAADDAIAIKGLANEDQVPASLPANKNLTFKRMQLWNDCNNAFGMGAETRASEYENIKLLDSDILFSYDDPNHHTQLDERSAMNICALQGTFFRNILFENIRVNNCERLIGMCFKDNFWFGSIKGDQSTEGGINGVTFRNIECPNTSGSSIANEIRFEGWHQAGTPDKFIENILFDNVVIEGKLLTENNPYIKTNNTDELELVRNLQFLPISGIDDINKGPEITVSPTSVRQGEQFTIMTHFDKVEWQIYSINGKLLNSGTGNIVYTDNLPQSIYLIKIISGSKSATKKLLVR